MEKNRIRLRNHTPRKKEEEKGTSEMKKYSDQNKKRFVKWKILNSESINFLLVLVTVSCSIQFVLSAQVTGGQSGGQSELRQILHSASDNKSNKNESQKLNLKEFEKDCNKTSNKSKQEESEKVETILRDIFLDDELSDAALDAEDDDSSEIDQILSDFDVDDNDEDRQVLSKSVRHTRSVTDDNKSSLFPEGRSSRGGKKKGTRGAPEKEKNNSNNNNKGSKGGKKNAKKSSKKSTDLEKYNEYMDAVFNRMNVMIKRKRMDPLRVNLFAGPSKSPQGQGESESSSKNKNTKKKSGKTNKKKHSPRMDLDSEEFVELDEEEEEDYDINGPARKDIYLEVGHGHEHYDENGEVDTTKDDEEHKQLVRKIRALLENASNSSSVPLTDDDSPVYSDNPRGNDSKAKKPKASSSSNKGNGSKSQQKDKGQKNSSKANKNKSKGSNNSNKTNDAKNKESNNNKKKNSKAQNKPQKPTRGILHGLSSLKREGNVAVIRQGDKVRVVRSNFILGPVSLEIMPKKTKSEDDKTAVTATATAPKLRGVLEVRLKKGSATKIRKLRVYPPKNVKVDGTDASSPSTKSHSKPQQYRKVTPMATARLKQIASTVVRQTDKALKPPTR